MFAIERYRLGSLMIDLSQKLAAVLDELPIAVALVSRTGRFLGKAGGMANLLGDVVPSHNASEVRRWSFLDECGAAIPPNLWPVARALRGEANYAGLVGTVWHGEQHRVRVTCVPTSAPDSEVAAVSFLQFLDAPARSADGSDQELQQRLIRELAKAVATGWQNLQLAN